uniref:Uncharacterized protein n=1 Tax=Tanacetum cinerariifolium TaxID=118510 RepID=A0A699IT18_TANCI|nr:hypothetical protein [Tanacetum cinerariifolium]
MTYIPGSSGPRRFFRYTMFLIHVTYSISCLYIRSLSVMLSRISFNVLIRQYLRDVWIEWVCLPSIVIIGADGYAYPSLCVVLPNFSALHGRPFRCISDIWLLISGDAKIMPPRMRTRSVGRPAVESLGEGTGVRVGEGGRVRRPREGNDERVDDLNGQGNVGNQNGNVVNENI